jgi:hypothetical protein
MVQPTPKITALARSSQSVSHGLPGHSLHFLFNHCESRQLCLLIRDDGKNAENTLLSRSENTPLPGKKKPASRSGLNPILGGDWRRQANHAASRHRWPIFIPNDRYRVCE